ncbi:hypothetical protein [Bartonella sp. CM31XJBT]|uniref:hypothetical protein n=1 Tax=Bartonella sp. CM31XJBT TaxID=3019090 RepID=UPI0023622C39|nr:hypothetical protein [Bartonella sp. CM31XJBT]
MVVGRLGRKGANGGIKVGLCNASKLEWGNGGRVGGMEGVGGKGLMAMNRLMVGL